MDAASLLRPGYNHLRTVPVHRSPTRPLLLLLAAATLPAQSPSLSVTAPAARKPRTRSPSQPTLNPNVIFLDPAHGGSDPGATLAPGSLEKDANLAFARTLRDLLTPHGFTVLLSHESAATPVPPPPRPPQDPDNPDAGADQPAPPPFNPNANNPSLDARTEQANRSRAVACIIIHATPAGHGVHLYTSALTPVYTPPADDSSYRPLTPWDSAQSASLPLSTRLATDLAGGLAGIRIPLVSGHVSVRPIDSFACPTVALELAPFNNTPASDAAYQQRLAQSVAASLVTWRSHALPPAPATQPAATPANPAPSKPKSKPRPLVIPSESPVVLEPQTAPQTAQQSQSQTPAHKPAPIVRRTPPEPAPPSSGAPR